MAAPSNENFDNINIEDQSIISRDETSFPTGKLDLSEIDLLIKGFTYESNSESKKKQKGGKAGVTEEDENKQHY